jgi:anti-sigma B factor antagonist
MIYLNIYTLCKVGAWDIYNQYKRRIIMTINTEINANKAKLVLDSRLDTTTAPLLEAEVNGLPAEITEIVIDMEKVAYVSSAGLRVLLATQKVMNKKGSLILIGVCEEVMEVFEMTGFADILTIE